MSRAKKGRRRRRKSSTRQPNYIFALVCGWVAHARILSVTKINVKKIKMSRRCMCVCHSVCVFWYWRWKEHFVLKGTHSRNINSLEAFGYMCPAMSQNCKLFSFFIFRWWCIFWTKICGGACCCCYVKHKCQLWCVITRFQHCYNFCQYLECLDLFTIFE